MLPNSSKLSLSHYPLTKACVRNIWTLVCRAFHDLKRWFDVKDSHSQLTGTRLGS